MPTVFVAFANHFDLLWRRCWDRHYDYLGERYISYRALQNQLMKRNIELARQGQGCYEVEQGLSVRALLKEQPDLLEDMRTLYHQGLFEILGGGEAIVDQNQCHIETLIRNLASGVYFASEKLKMPPSVATIRDAFGSSAQYPQIVRGCGLRGVLHPSYRYPDKLLWRGLDGSCVFALRELPGTVQFFDHCYYEPCRACHGSDPKCTVCGGTLVDLPQGFYPEFQPVHGKSGELLQYLILSEEMFPPTDFAARMARWNQDGAAHYEFGTTRKLAALWESWSRQTDHPPADQIATGVDNSPAQSGCLVSRSRIKLRTRACEQSFYAWETAAACTPHVRFKSAEWENLFLELPLYLFHDAVTGTHQDEASRELLDRMDQFHTQLHQVSSAAVGNPASTKELAIDVFQPSLQAGPLRVPLALEEQRITPLVALSAEGTAYPVVYDHHAFGPALPASPTTLIVGVGPSSRVRPKLTHAMIETTGLPPLVWSTLKLKPAKQPTAITGNLIENNFLKIALGTTGIRTIEDKRTGTIMAPQDHDVGELLLESDEGDPWNTRQVPGLQRSLKNDTHYLGALRFEGYSEAYFGGRFTPNQRFGREEDPAIFGLEWYVTVRLLDLSDRIDFTYEIFWNTSNRRLRAIFPTAATTDTATYSIPGGYLSRPHYEPEGYDMFSGKGDWPALHFVATQPDDHHHAWAVVNYGTPSARVDKGNILISLLRSPAYPHCLERYAQSYPMPTSQMRDPGWHQIRLSLLPLDQTEMTEVAQRAAALNTVGPAIQHRPQQPPEPPLLSVSSKAIQLLSVKLPFNHDASRRIVRLLNDSASAEKVSIRLAPQIHHAALVNLIEQERETLAVVKQNILVPFKPFEIRTLELTISGED